MSYFLVRISQSLRWRVSVWFPGSYSNPMKKRVYFPHSISTGR